MAYDCWQCGRTFEKAQSVRAHSRWCTGEAEQPAPAAAAAPMASLPTPARELLYYCGACGDGRVMRGSARGSDPCSACGQAAGWSRDRNGTGPASSSTSSPRSPAPAPAPPAARCDTCGHFWADHKRFPSGKIQCRSDCSCAGPPAHQLCYVPAADEFDAMLSMFAALNGVPS